VIGASVLGVGAVLKKFVPASSFDFMEKLDLETDTNDNTVTKCYARIFRKQKDNDDDEYKKLPE